jgi:hypothetical protein
MAEVIEIVAIDEVSPETRERRVLDAASAIVGGLERTVQQQMSAKSLVENRWLEDLRNYWGEYEPGKKADLVAENRSIAFVGVTRHKTNSWAARLSDLLFPTDERNWGIKPTPVPKLGRVAKEHATAAMLKIEQANDASEQAAAAQDPAQADALAAAAEQSAAEADEYGRAVRLTQGEISEAKDRCERMEAAIWDQLVESNYSAQCRDVIEDGCRLGTGILKGPMTSSQVRREWRENGYGSFEMVQSPDPHPLFMRVDPWHFFPDMSARTIQEAEFTFERSLPTKKDLRRYAMKFGFNKGAVRRLLQEGPGEIPGTDLTYLANLKDMIGENTSSLKGRYVMWEYHGPLECEDIAILLRAAGDEGAAREYEENIDPLDEYRVIIHFCGSEVLKIAPEYPLDSGDSLYSVWNFEKGETSIFGYGVPRIARDSQNVINGAWRMMQDNAGLGVGPQIIIDKNAIIPQDGNWSLQPLKVWLRSTTVLSNAANPAFQAVHIESNQAALGEIINIANAFLDEETASPKLDQGDAGQQAQTLGGMSMLFNSMNVLKRRVVKAWDDDLTKPTIRRAYDWNMQNNPDNTIKGDMQVDARGTSVLLVREIQSVHLMNVAQNWSTHPELGPRVKVHDAASKALQTLMIDPADILYDEEEADRRVEERAAALAPQQDTSRLEVAQLEAQTRVQVAEINRDTVMAELALRERLSIAEVQSKFGIEKEKIGSQERIKASEIAIESEREDRAVAAGLPATEGSGKEIG